MAGPTEVIVHTDGASRGNPGPAAIGVVITDPQGRVLLELGEALERTTNNVAEYTAVIRALERARDLGARRVRCLMDSQLVVRQLNGSYKVKHADMLPLYRRVLELIQQFDEVTFAHVPREMNTEADRLANAALDSPAPKPQSEVDRFFRNLLAGRWEEARQSLAHDFRYRRPAAKVELDAARFLAAWRKQPWGGLVSPSMAREAGGDVILETFAGPPGVSYAIVWLCRLEGGKIQSLVEYRDRGD